MIVLAKYEADTDKHTVNSIVGDEVHSVSFYNTKQGKHILKEWIQPLDSMGCRSVDQYVRIMTKRGFRRVEQA